MSMKQVLAVLAATSITGPAWSDDLLDCVDPDIKAAFLWKYDSGETRISRDTPAVFSAMRFPDSFEYIGSSSSEQSESIAQIRYVDAPPISPVC